mmetsp:Transcript_42405/g.100813  ORF Transcript_42405/g.100813 Transcript_42405/m.100813 type:complete len:236 (-) Transcript_42405:186-893(-)
MAQETRCLLLGRLRAQLLELLGGDGHGAELLALALAGLLGELEERLAEGGVAVIPASRLPQGLAALAEGGLGEELDVRADEELVLLIVVRALVGRATEGLVEGGDNGVAGGVHELGVEVRAGLPGDEDGGLPREGEHVLETLTEVGAVVIRGRAGDQPETGGILGNVGDAEPLRVLAASLLVGASPDREGEENPEADDRAEVVDRRGEAHGIASDLVDEGDGLHGGKVLDRVRDH